MLREYWLEITHTAGARVVVMILGIMSISITARWLGPEGRGIVATIITWATLSATLFSLSLGQVSIKHASLLNDGERLNRLFPALLKVFLLIAGLGLFGVLLLYQMNIYVGDVEPTFFVVLALFLFFVFSLWGLYTQSLLQIIDRIKQYNYFQMAGSVIGFISIIVLVVLFDMGAEGMICANLIALFFVGILSYRYLRKRSTGISALRNPLPKRFLSDAIKLHPMTIGSIMNNSIDIVMIGYFIGSIGVGEYQLAAKMIAMMLIIPQSVSLVLYGKLVNTGAVNSWEYQGKILIQTISAVFMIGFAAYLVAPFVIPLLAGNEFTNSVPVFQLLLFTLIGKTFSSVMASQWIVRGLFVQASLLTLTIGVLNVTANFLLIPAYGIIGAVWATMGVSVVSIIANGGLAVKCQIEYNEAKSRAI